MKKLHGSALNCCTEPKITFSSVSWNGKISDFLLSIHFRCYQNCIFSTFQSNIHYKFMQIARCFIEMEIENHWKIKELRSITKKPAHIFSKYIILSGFKLSTQKQWLLGYFRCHKHIRKNVSLHPKIIEL